MRRGAWIALFGLALLLAWRVTDTEDEVADRPARRAASEDAAESRGGGFRGRSDVRLPRAADTDTGMVAITGRVIERGEHAMVGVGGVEVVFRSDAGEAVTTSEHDGSYRIIVPAGSYRAFVRDDSVLSLGPMARVRLPELPSAEQAGAPDEQLMPQIAASHDLDGVDLAVVRGGVIAGRVVDLAGRPIARVAVRGTSVLGERPALGTDVTETDADGRFELQMPIGGVELQAAHPRYAGAQGPKHAYVTPGERTEVEIELIAGCVISGRVVRADGKPAGDGALERSYDGTQFGVDSKIAADGTFRWVTPNEEQVILRAWPWKSPPSQAQTFACRDGARFDQVVFALPPSGPDLSGVLVDAAGAPVPFAYIDLTPLDAGGIAQQERTDAEGNWGVFAMPAGRYHVTAFAPGRGFLATEVAIPNHSVRLALGALGRIEGKAPRIEHGTIAFEPITCGGIELDHTRRLVSVTDGRFTLDGVPSCNLMLRASWQGEHTEVLVEVPAGGSAELELDLGPPQPITVTGRVLDAEHRPAPGVEVHATSAGDHQVSTVTDAAGRFTLKTLRNAEIYARSGDLFDRAIAGDEEVVLALNAPDHSYLEPSLEAEVQ